MIAATEKALKELGVPFFDIRADLVRRQGELANDRKYDDEAAAANKYDGNIGEEELLGLKTKMVELLEDLCKE